jgi:hypothetical protein|tara:strand:- start:46 stop:258 length:213 start_codon:yes stop_codon:yes gene_type:complete
MEIESDVPLVPHKSSKGSGENQHIALRMKSGDSIFFDSFSKCQSFYLTMRGMGLNATTRKQMKGYRIWRL